MEGKGGNIVSSNLLKNEKCSVDSFSIELKDNRRNKVLGVLAFALSNTEKCPTVIGPIWKE